jgi:hypothetical protein
VRGVNRHEHDDVTGRHVTAEMVWEDVTLMKRLNINAVRTSHYPNRCSPLPPFCKLMDTKSMVLMPMKLAAHSTAHCTVPRFIFFAHVHHVNTTPYILHPKSCIIHAKSCILHPASNTLNFISYTLNTKPKDAKFCPRKNRESFNCPPRPGILNHESSPKS